MRRAASVVLLSLAIAAPSAADEPTRHVVVAGDTCAAIALKYWGDARLVDVLHRANPTVGNLPPPHVLREGTVLVIPSIAPPASGPDAQLTTVRNVVDVLAPETRPGKPNDPLFRGNRVSTHESSAADVTFRDESQVKLGERTLVIILGDAGGAAKRTSEPQTRLMTGDLRAWMSSAKKDAVVAVDTDAAGVRVFGGEAAVSADAKKTTRLAVYAGASTITAQSRTRELVRGFGSKAELGREPTPPRPLPSAPTWTVRPDSVVVDRGAPLTIAGEYDLVPPGSHVDSWRVQVGGDPSFREVVSDVKVPATVKRFEITPPGPGRYYVRASAIDDDRFEGPFGLAARVLVIRTRFVPAGARRTLVIEPPEAACMRVGNVPLFWVKGPIDVGLEEPVRLRCAPFETDPTTLLSLD